MGKCESATHVVGATEMRRVKAVASAMEMAPTMASATMTTASVASAMASAASAQCGARQHDRQRNNHSPNSQF
jgi:hypothetical protein